MKGEKRAKMAKKMPRQSRDKGVKKGAEKASKKSAVAYIMRKTRMPMLVFERSRYL